MAFLVPHSGHHVNVLLFYQSHCYIVCIVNNNGMMMSLVGLLVVVSLVRRV